MKRLYNTSDKMYSTREVQSAFTHAYYLGKAPKEYDTEKAFKEWDNENERNTSKGLTIDAILNAVSWQSGITTYSIREQSSKPTTVSRARQFACWFGYHYTNISMKDIAQATHAATHATALHRARDVESYLSIDKRVIRDIDAIKNYLLADGYALNYKATRFYKESELINVVMLDGVMVKTKMCKMCGKEKELSSFRVRGEVGKDGHRNECKECMKRKK